MTDSILEQIAYEYELMKDERRRSKKEKKFYWKELHIIHDYIRNHPYNPEREFLYKIVSAFWIDSWVRWTWDHKRFAMPYYTKNMKIYDDTSYNYNEFSKKYVPDLFPDEDEDGSREA